MARMLRSTDTLLLPAVQATINELQLGPSDTGEVRLAQRYAATIDAADDEGDTLERLGPKLLACLESLGATPKARAAMKTGGGGGAQGQGKLAAIRQARRSA